MPKIPKIPVEQRMKILLTNGRFPVALDLARQLHKVGHSVYTVDPMHYNVAKFSRSVKQTFRVPAPHDGQTAAMGYVENIRIAVATLGIQLIIPMHEEIFYLAQVDDLRPLLFVVPYHTLFALHNKWHFYQLAAYAGLGVPPTMLCTSMEDVRQLDRTGEYALKPAFGRALSGVFHVKPGEPLPEVDPTPDLPYIAQEWVKGKQLCSYCVARNGEVKVASVYPVIDTIDGSSCVYFESVEHPGIKRFMETLVATYNLTGQLAFDFIEAADGKLYALECNPRATSGLHLFNTTNVLVEAFTNPYAPRRDADIGKKVQMFPGMLMWEPKESTKQEKKAHMRRLLRTRDILFRASDPLPALFQPFLYVTYKKYCHEKQLKLKELFQWDVIWEPNASEIQRARDDARLAGDAVTAATLTVPSVNLRSPQFLETSVLPSTGLPPMEYSTGAPLAPLFQETVPVAPIISGDVIAPIPVTIELPPVQSPIFAQSFLAKQMALDNQGNYAPFHMMAAAQALPTVQ